MRYLLKIIFMRPAVWGRGADYSCPLGSLEAAQRDPGGGWPSKTVGNWEVFQREKFKALFSKKTKSFKQI